MNMKSFLAIAGAAILTLSTPSFAKTQSSPIVMGYWTNWGPYWTIRPYSIANNPDFDAQLNQLNVLAYAFMEVDQNGSVQFSDTWSDLSAADANFCSQHAAICLNQIPTQGLGNFHAFSDIHQRHPAIKLVFSIGGAGHDASFQNAFQHPDTFVQSVVALVKAYNLDGVDLDFEPAQWDATTADQYLALVQKLRLALPQSFITAAVSANPTLISAFDGTTHRWQTLLKSIDVIGVMAYDLHGGYDGVGQKTAFHSNLYSDSKDPYATHYSADAAVQAYLATGVPADQIILGVPAYGRIEAGVAAGDTHGLYQPFTSTVRNGDLGDEMESYYTIASHWLGNGFTDYWYSVDNRLSGIFAYNTQTALFVSFDNVAMIDAKVAYVKTHQLRGMMMWELRADLSPKDPNNASLLKHMHDGLL